MWIVCITSVRHVLTVNGYGGRQTKENEKSWCFKGWETLVNFIHTIRQFILELFLLPILNLFTYIRFGILRPFSDELNQGKQYPVHQPLASILSYSSLPTIPQKSPAFVLYPHHFLKRRFSVYHQPSSREPSGRSGIDTPTAPSRATISKR